jgi:phosphoglycerol transferase MdoB-like AlkP superfamily enzyme
MHRVPNPLQADLMPKYLLSASILYIASRGAMAVLAPLYETGILRVTSPILMVFFVIVAVLFMRRIQWTWRFMLWIAFTEIVINAFFFPEPKFHGVYTQLARLLIAMVMVACSVILWSITRHKDSKAWFHNRKV